MIKKTVNLITKTTIQDNSLTGTEDLSTVAGSEPILQEEPTSVASEIQKPNKKSFFDFIPSLFSRNKVRKTDLLNNTDLMNAIRHRKGMNDRSDYDVNLFIDKLSKKRPSKINKYVDDIITASNEGNDIKVTKIMEEVQGKKIVDFYDKYKPEDLDNPNDNNVRTQLTTIGDALADFDKFFGMSADELWGQSTAVSVGLQGQSLGDLRFFYFNENTKELITPKLPSDITKTEILESGYKKYAIKSIGKRSSSVEKEFKASLFFFKEGMGPNVWLGKKSDKDNFFLITEWVDGINVKDIIIDADPYASIRPGRKDILKRIIENTLQIEFSTYDDAVKAYATAILNDNTLMAKIDKFKELLNNNFAFVDDVQFIAVPSVNGSESKFAVIDAGGYYLRRTGNPNNSKKVDFLMDKLREFRDTPEGQSLPYINNAIEPFDIRMIK